MMYNNSCDHRFEIDIPHFHAMVVERKFVKHYKYLGIAQVINVTGFEKATFDAQL